MQLTRTVQDVYEAIDRFAPFDTAEAWDHVGLQIGDRSAEVTRALVCLDVTQEAVAQARAAGAQLIVSHHPPLFEPVHELPADSIPYRLAASGIAVIAAHTNLDRAAGGVNDCLCDALGLTDTTPVADGLGRIGTLPSPLTSAAFADQVGAALHTSVRVHEGAGEVRRVAVVCGSGGDLLPSVRQSASPDAFVTGEIKHHEWLGAGDMTVIEAGHYATERVVVEPLATRLSAALPEIIFIAFEGGAPYETR
ncbi:MAG: Nif3-like dinuclear metal center hexameric protein [Clostridia bacterium]|nr:Nif3-like dinuclear metal center hexameric protein [Clostridia bacterium]